MPNVVKSWEAMSFRVLYESISRDWAGNNLLGFEWKSNRRIKVRLNSKYFTKN